MKLIIATFKVGLGLMIFSGCALICAPLAFFAWSMFEACRIISAGG